MEVRKVSNPLGLAVLAVLRVEPSHPYQIASTLRQWHKEQSIRINYGSLYTIITSLERAGFIEARDVERAGARPERTIYGLTDEGAKELDDWMRELISTPVKEYPLFGAALSLIAALPPEDVPDLLEKRLTNLDRKLAEGAAILKQCQEQKIERLFIIESEYERAILEAEREWVKKLIPLVRESEEFTRTWRSWYANDYDRATVYNEPGEK